MKKLQFIPALATALSLISLSAQAVTQTGVSTGPSTTTAETTYDANISNSDLLTGLTATLTSGSGPVLNHLSGINDGTAQPLNNSTNSTYFGHNINDTTLNSDPVVTFTLNTSVNTQGYTLTSINSIYGWQNFQSMADQYYTISYTTVSNPVFSLLTTVNYAPYDPATDNSLPPAQQYSSSQVTLTDLGNITGVNAIRFSFMPLSYTDATRTTVQAGQMIREIDVNGFATPAPEPSTWALMGLGVMALAFVSRRRVAAR